MQGDLISGCTFWSPAANLGLICPGMFHPAENTWGAYCPSRMLPNSVEQRCSGDVETGGAKAALVEILPCNTSHGAAEQGVPHPLSLWILQWNWE